MGWWPFTRRSKQTGAVAQTLVVRAKFDSAQTNADNRRHWANADGLSADGAANPEVRRTLRNRARYEVANNSYARGIVLTLANDVTGTGPRLQMLLANGDSDEANQTIEREFIAWAKAVDLPGKLRTMRMARAQDGEAFVMLFSNGNLNSPVKLDLKLIEADQVATPSPKLGVTGAALAVDGIEFDPFGNPAAYHILKSHPGASTALSTSSLDYERVRADSVIHWFRADRPGQRRGLPDILPALPLFAQLRRYTLAVKVCWPGNTAGEATAPERTAATADRWAGVAGMRELKAILERDVILPFLQPDIYRRYRISLPNGVLLYGPPGCGKTYIAEKLGKILGFHCISVKPSDLGSPYVHGTQKAIGELFDEASEHRPCLIFLDELDALIPNRFGGDVGHHYASEVNEFLTQLNNAADRRILVVGATNRLDKLDPAALRPGRFDKKVLVSPPDLEARVELLRLYLKDRPQEPIDLLKLAVESEGFTCAEMEYIVTEAARRALSRRRTICTEDVMAALADNPPANNESTSAET